MIRPPFGSTVKPKIRIGAFWQRVADDSEKYLSGEFEITEEFKKALSSPQKNKGGKEVIRVSVVKNKDKQPGTYQPDYRLILDT
jgi:uncharacterized protein (DUF736 family)